MNTLSVTGTLAFLAAFITGCAGGPYQYKDNLSYANNVAKAAGIYQLQDNQLPENTKGISSDGQFLVNTAGTTAALTSNFGVGMSLKDGLGVGLALSLFEPPPEAARNTIIAWMPESTAGDTSEARDKLFDHLNNAMKATLDELGIFHSFHFSRVFGNPQSSILMKNHEWGCGGWDGNGDKNGVVCSLSISTRKPELVTSPTFLSEHTDNRSYQFATGSMVSDIEFTVRGGRANVPQDTILGTISKHLPEWIYLYQAPGKTQGADGEYLPFPFILNQGKVHLFITPQAMM